MLFIVCRAYNFEDDQRWNDYLLGVTFPPSCRDDLVLKTKAKWYKREIDSELDIETVVPAAPKPSTAASAPPPQTRREPDPPQPRWQSNTSSNRSTTQAPPASSGPAKRLVLSDYALLFGHIVLVVSCIFALQPFDQYLALKAFSYFSKASLFVHGYRVSIMKGIMKYILCVFTYFAGLRVFNNQSSQ